MKTYIGKAMRWFIASAACSGLAVGALAATDAGETITNLATVTYEDALGNSFQVQSNEAVVTVAQVYSATLEEDRSTTSAPLTQASFVHILTNTGNGSDTYTITGTEYAAGAAGPDGVTLADVGSNITAIYLDTNGNNTADAGDTLLWDGSVQGTVTLGAGEIGTLIMLVDVPAGSDGDVLFASLNAAGSSGTVDDLTAANGLDGVEGTNDDTITITTGPAFNVVKTAEVVATGVDHTAIDPSLTSASVIEYTIEVTNTGGATASDVNILDAIPEGTFLLPSSISGAGLGNIGDDAGASTTFDETNGAFANGGVDSDPFDANLDGDSADIAVAVVRATDASMTVGTTVRLTFQVAYDPTNTDFDTVYGDNDGSLADESIDNTAFADVDGDSNPPTPSNPESIPLADVVTYAVDLDDTEENNGPADTTNNGEDDDGDNDTQFVTQAYEGEQVLFNNEVTNNGSAADTFTLTTSGSTFPAGTTFRFFTSTGVELAGAETPQVQPGETIIIQVRAQLPAGTTGVGPYDVVVTATSVNDPSATPASDTKTESLGEILAARVDIANGTAITVTNGADDADAADTDVANTAAGETAAITTTAAAPGADVTFPLVIANESGSADSFAIAAGAVSNVNDPLATFTQGLPAGWQVEFIDQGVLDATGAVVQAGTGLAINTTELLPSGYAQLVNAVVTVASDASVGTQDVYFRVRSASTGLQDIKRDAVTVDVVCSLDLSANPELSIQQGGSQDFLHSFSNNSNVTKTFSLSVDDASLPAGWTATLLVDVTTDDLVDPNTIHNGSGSSAITVWDGVGSPDESAGTLSAANEISLAPGETVYFTVKLFAPSDAAVDSTASVTVSMTDTGDGSCLDTTTDTARVVPPMDLAKTAAVDIDCDCDSTGLTFLATQTTDVAPNQCVIWRLVAHNESTVDALNVEITDARTNFTEFEPATGDVGSPSSCAGNPAACTSDDYTTTVSGTDISWDVGTLSAGGYATAEFCVRVQ